MARAGRARKVVPEGPAPSGADPADDLPMGQLELDRLIHERMRLGIVSALAGHGWVSFAELKDALGTTDGNLSVHARKLEDAGYVECRKSFVARVPRTDFRLTRDGRAALEGYLDHMEALIRRTRNA